MATALPARNILDGTALPVTSQMKTALGSTRDYLADLLGVTGIPADARTALIAAKSGANSDITSIASLTSLPTPLTPVGNGQTWQDLTASRALGTTYTNSTTRTITVSVSINSTGAGNVIVSPSVAGAVMSLAQIPASGTGFVMNSTFIVQPGATYSMATGGVNALYQWSELR